MSCDFALHHLDDFLDGALDQAGHRTVETHLAECRDCAARLRREEELRRALRELPAPPTPEGLVAAGKARAAERAQRRWTLGLAGMAAAASLALAIAVGLLVAGPGGSAVPTLAVTPGKTEQVRLVFNSPERVQEVTVTLELPDGVELAGYPGRKSLSWRTDLEEGRNLLELPVVLNGPGGVLRAGLEFNGHSRRFDVSLKARTPDRSDLLPAGNSA